jgi:hypothetical protein
MIYAVELASYGMIYLGTSMNIDPGVQAILRFCLNKFKDCNVGITDGWDL